MLEWMNYDPFKLGNIICAVKKKVEILWPKWEKKEMIFYTVKWKKKVTELQV